MSSLQKLLDAQARNSSNARRGQQPQRRHEPVEPQQRQQQQYSPVEQQQKPRQQRDIQEPSRQQLHQRQREGTAGVIRGLPRSGGSNMHSDSRNQDARRSVAEAFSGRASTKRQDQRRPQQAPWQNKQEPQRQYEPIQQQQQQQHKQLQQHQRYHHNENDRRYAELRANIEQSARRQASQFMQQQRRTAVGGGKIAAHDVAIASEVATLRTWVGELRGDGACTYFQDLRKRYPFKTFKEGYELLQSLLDTNEVILRANMELILQQGDPQYVMAVGEQLYEVKPYLKAYGTTWSQEEYGHPGFQRSYIKLKSLQRFTETWATLERTLADGLFDVHREAPGPDAEPIRIASMGGGPGYELLAAKLFFERIAPGTRLELVSLDLCPFWVRYVQALGYEFIHWDLNDGDLHKTMGLEVGQLTYVIISYVLIYCTDDKTVDMLAGLLRDWKVRAIIVSERSESTPCCRMMENRGIKVARLMDQSMGLDERQCVYVSDPEFLRSTSDKPRYKFDPTFPNVPFSEHKPARQQGGHKLTWRPFHGT